MAKHFILNKNVIMKYPEQMTLPIKNVIDIFERDFKKVFGFNPETTSDEDEATLVIRHANQNDQIFEREEAYSYRFIKRNDNTIMHLIGADDLGIIYGLLSISTNYLEVDPYWFWADLKVETKENIYIPMKDYDSEQPTVRYRGWFVNDEVCLLGWKKEFPPTKEVWFPVFETLLRSGGNMVIPGTDLPKHGIHFDLALEMGLWITHHHAEPLGAEMFKRAHPNEIASYTQNKELYEQLWENAIQKQKDQKVIWVLSFRGQGDQPFWIQDPSYDTPEKRGQLISEVLYKQKEMVEQYVQDPVCCVALYGEISELYKNGYIDIPDGVIRMWADNGYGKMVSRRNGNEDFRVPAMPEPDIDAKQGIYYHVTFHDLQASNHLTMFPSHPSLITDELEQVMANGGDDYLLLNSGNIRMHLYTLDIVSEMWNKGKLDLEQHLTSFLSRMFSSHIDEIQQLYEVYFDATIQFGEHADNKAGEQYYHHPARKIIGHWLQGKEDTPMESLFWTTGNKNMIEQVQYFKEKYYSSYQKWLALKKKCDALSGKLSDDDRMRFQDIFGIQVELHLSGAAGFIRLCEAFEFYKKEDYPKAFVAASQSLWEYQVGYDAMRRSEHGKWKDFYRADWLTNVEWTMESVITLRKYLRMQGDNPDYFIWYKQYLMPETEKHIYLENTHREPLYDDDLAKKLEKKFLEEGFLQKL